MIHVEIIASGRMRDKSLLSLWQDYTKRIHWPLKLHEIEAKKKDDEKEKILKKINTHSYLFVLDERGKTLPSPNFAKQLSDISLDGTKSVQFIIGSADGLDQEIREKANFLLSFGAQTWPHMLTRIMLAEQLYRAQQIIGGHPYHRD